MYNIEYTIEGKMSIFIGRREVDNSDIWGKNSTDVSLNTTNISGNVGIGISNPTYKLDVSGNARIRGILQVGSIPSVAIQDTLDWSSNTTERATLKNIGIGITNPTRALEVSGNVVVSSNLTNTGLTSGTGSATVSTANDIKSIDHYGNMSVTTMSSLSNMYAPCANIGFTDNNLYHTNVNISGDVYISDILMDYDDPYDFKVRSVMYTDNSGYQRTNAFTYIDKYGTVVANAITGTGTTIAGASARKSIYFPVGYENEEAEKVYQNIERTFVITKTGKVFSIGANGYGSCGIDGSIQIGGTISDLTRVFTRDSSGNDLSANNVMFKKIIASESDSRASYGLTTTGDLYACGWNGSGALADGSNNTLETTDSTRTFKCPNLVSFLDFGRLRNFVADAVGVGSWDGNTGYPQTVCVLDNSGGIWCAGYSGQYQTGIGSTSAQTQLIRVKTNASTTISSGISSVYTYGVDYDTGFMALSTTGQLYAWGHNNTDISLNRTGTDLQYATLINTSIVATNNTVSKVWTTNDQNGPFFVQTTNGLLYGTGQYYGLGTGIASGNGWRQITHFNTTTKQLQQLYCVPGSTNADQSNFAVTLNSTTGKYTLWATGDNANGQLGVGNTTYQNTWINVGLHSDIVQQITNIVGEGPKFVCILLRNGRILQAGLRIPLYNDSTNNNTRFTYLS